MEVLNRGVNGDMVSLLLARPRRYESDVAKQAPLDFIFLRFGLNDVRHLKDFKTEFPGHYKKLIAPCGGSSQVRRSFLRLRSRI